MGLYELILSYDSDDAEALAPLILEEVLNDAELVQEIILPALRSAITRTLRQAAYLTEQQSILSTKPTASADADRLAFLAEKFYVPGVGFVSWAEATITHHQARIDYLNKKVNGLVDTITLHDKAIQDIKRAGAKNLGEIHGKRRRTRKAS